MSDITLEMTLEDSIAVVTALDTCLKRMPTGPMLGRGEAQQMLIKLSKLQSEYAQTHPQEAVKKILALRERAINATVRLKKFLDDKKEGGDKGGG